MLRKDEKAIAAANEKAIRELLKVRRAALRRLARRQN
jgi:hypothetical protein